MSGDEVRPVALVPLLCSTEPPWVRCQGTKGRFRATSPVPRIDGNARGLAQKAIPFRCHRTIEVDPHRPDTYEEGRIPTKKANRPQGRDAKPGASETRQPGYRMEATGCARIHALSWHRSCSLCCRVPQ